MEMLLGMIPMQTAGMGPLYKDLEKENCSGTGAWGGGGSSTRAELTGKLLHAASNSYLVWSL